MDFDRTLMKYSVISAILWYILVTPATTYSKDPARITAQELKAMMERGEIITLIDVRSTQEYNSGHIPGAVNIPLKELSTLNEFPYHGKVYLYCTAGIRSMKAKRILEKKGVKGVVDLEGGIEAWKKVGGRVVTSSRPSSWHKDDDPQILSGYPKSYQVPKGVCEQGLNPSLVISK